ncbi:hypothetical protein JB92DRAFT_2961756 [Gautieria morchelliformis]|nr:hypothetical protein JB92DRAFT_2961756 [Gautieria morchelliformis]
MIRCPALPSFLIAIPRNASRTLAYKYLLYTFILEHAICIPQSISSVIYPRGSTTVSGGSLHRYQPSSLIDTCANVNSEIKVLGLVSGRLGICLCVSDIPSLLSTNLNLQAAVRARCCRHCDEDDRLIPY